MRCGDTQQYVDISQTKISIQYDNPAPHLGQCNSQIDRDIALANASLAA